MPKSSKRFVLHTEALNYQGFRMLTSGCDMGDFEKNPVMLFNHISPEGNSPEQIMPIGHWEDITVKDGVISAVPVFDDRDEFALSIYNKVETGALRMCSVGALPLETSDDPALALPGQTGETVTRWKLKECSIVAFGANPDALSVSLYDQKERLIQLHTEQHTIIPKLKKMAKQTNKSAAAAAPAKKVQLADDPNLELEDDGLENMAEETPEEKIARLEAEIEALKQQLQNAQSQLSLADEKAQEQKDEQMADKAIALRKITMAQKPHILRMLKADREGTVHYLNSIKASVSVKEALANNPEKSAIDERIKTLSAKSFDELFKAKGELEYVKLHAPEVYEQKYQAKFGKKPQ